MKQNHGSFRNSGAYTSPGTPEYGENNVGDMPKGWSSERVPLSSSRRHIGAAALIPFNSGRALPSKWDDAERWITSPVSGYGAFKNTLVQPPRRPKSKSGPLGPSGPGYLSNYSPNFPLFESGKVRNFMGNSPLTTGVLVPEGLAIHYDSGLVGKSNSLYSGNDMMRTTSVPGLSDLVSESSMPSSQGDNINGIKDEEEAVSHRDMATQMSPDGSTHSSVKERLSFSTLPSSLPTSFRRPSNVSAKVEIRDVQVDKGTTTSRESKRHGLKKTKKDSTSVDNLPSPWDISEASKNTSKLQREEAKITAWENLQKAKAEAAIRKLEMKLEKKRSSSMDKIMNKLKSTERKAEKMRNSSESHAHRASRRTSHRRIRCCIYVKISSLSNCFRCHKN